MTEHLDHLELVLYRLYSHHFYVKFSKCPFCKESIDYLGHIVSLDGVQADPKKIEVMVQWPIPKIVKQLRGFMGLIVYYRRFIAGYATIVAPLTDILLRDYFEWTSAASSAFELLKRVMVAAPVLCLPDFTKEFVLETDASNEGIGAVLIQQGHPIAYFIQKLGIQLRNSSVYISELHGITATMLKWRQYLLGLSFVIRTDHRSLKDLLQQVIQTLDQRAYVRKLLGFQFRIEYKPEITNCAADALPLVPTEWEDEDDTAASTFLALISGPLFHLLDKLKHENILIG